MAYIGAEPLPGQNREVDDISSSFNGSTTAFTLQVNGLNTSPESANNILVNIGGVLQNPGTDYTVAASTLTFTTAPAAGLSFFGLILGAGINTATVADDTIGASKLIDTAVTAGSYTTADITVDAQGRITAAANGTIATAEIADGAVNNAKVNASAAIAGTKISPDFGSQAISTTNDSVTIGDSIIHSGDTNTKIRFPSADTFSIETDGSERARVTSSGRLLLGHSSSRPVAGNTNRIFQIENGTSDIAGVSIVRNAASSGGPFISFGKSRAGSTGGTTIVQDGDTLGTISFAGADGTNLESRGADIFAQVDGTPGVDDMPGRLIFSTTPDGSVSPAERLRIDSSGNLFLGCTSQPSASVHGLEATGSGFILTSKNGTGLSFHHQFFNDNGAVGQIATSGSSTAYQTSSDYRLKENAVAISDGITRLKTLKPYRFNFKADSSTTVDGFFAHEVTAVPEAISGTKDEVDSDNNPIYQGIDQSKLVPLLTAALQEAVTKIETLETKVAALEAA